MMIDVLREQRKCLRASPVPEDTYERMLQEVKIELLDERIMQLQNRLARQVRGDAEDWLTNLVAKHRHEQL